MGLGAEWGSVEYAIHNVRYVCRCKVCDMDKWLHNVSTHVVWEDWANEGLMVEGRVYDARMGFEAGEERILPKIGINVRRVGKYDKLWRELRLKLHFFKPYVIVAYVLPGLIRLQGLGK